MALFLVLSEILGKCDHCFSHPQGKTRLSGERALFHLHLTLISWSENLSVSLNSPMTCWAGSSIIKSRAMPVVGLSDDNKAEY